MAFLIKNAQIVNEGRVFEGDILIKNDRIERIDSSISVDFKVTEIDAKGQLCMPGVIDDQVHFREPGLTHKAEIYTEARAAVVGGTTSFMEMPNTVPQATTRELLEKKYAIGANRSLANYSFFFGATNDNTEEVLRVDKENVCGVKIFMGSSTGNMLVDDEQTLKKIFCNCDHLIATHCEKEEIVRANTALFVERYGHDIPFTAHPEIRSVEACYASSSQAIELAKACGSRLHILHLTTAKELDLFTNEIPLEKKRITAEVCVHHLWFSDVDYLEKGALIKCNPAVKSKSDRAALWAALKDNRLDIIATDHAPHTWDEKQGKYMSAPSGLPLVQHSLQAMLSKVNDGEMSLEIMVEKMCHAPAKCFNLHERGYLREGYKADIVLVDTNKPYTVSKANILHKCGWSPFEGHTFNSTITHTWVSGHLAWQNGMLNDNKTGERLKFNQRS
ncbi:MAG: dihydroorotase [Bacteroidetes bacterium]|nr:dihydroorotase [Bacteroidota bacterium]